MRSAHRAVSEPGIEVVARSATRKSYQAARSVNRISTIPAEKAASRRIHRTVNSVDASPGS